MRKYLAILIFLIGCENDTIVDITNQCEFPGSKYFGICFSDILNKGLDEIMIMNEKSYQEFGDSIRIYPYNLNCDTAVLPHIDFDKYSLIGKFTSGGGCDAEYKRQIIDNKIDKKIIYNITAEYSGDCYMLIINMNWALIPKIPINYTIEFKVR